MTDSFYLKIVVKQHVVYKLCHSQSSCPEQSILPSAEVLPLSSKEGNLYLLQYISLSVRVCIYLYVFSYTCAVC